MPKLYLLGGENVHRQSAINVNETAFQEAGSPLTIGVFPWARASFDMLYRQRKFVTDYFISLGASTVDFIDYSDPNDIIRQKISSSNLLYLTGGLVNALIERLKKTGVDAVLKDYPGIIVGRSAGALALCDRCLVTSRLRRHTLIVEGLGLADLTLKAHYRPQNDRVLMMLSKKEKIYAVPSGSAIIYKGGISSFIGKVYLFEDGKKQKLDLFS